MGQGVVQAIRNAGRDDEVFVTGVVTVRAGARGQEAGMRCSRRRSHQSTT
jgi:hypothetical protein